MKNPDPSICVNVDVTNPGQFFACCGFLELAGRLWPGAEGWFGENRFLIAGHPECSLHALLKALAESTVANTMTPVQNARLEQLSAMKKKQRKKAREFRSLWETQFSRGEIKQWMEFLRGTSVAPTEIAASSAAATARMVASTGPMHGVHPIATTAPRARAREPRSVAGGRADAGFGTRSRTGPNRPVMSSPSTITTTPASCRTSGSRNKAIPIRPTDIPSRTNTVLNPSVKRPATSSIGRRATAAGAAAPEAGETIAASASTAT
jgi:hypothetical protein